MTIYSYMHIKNGLYVDASQHTQEKKVREDFRQCQIVFEVTYMVVASS